MKWSLNCTRGAYAGQTFEFTAAQVSIGRAPGNALPLDPEKEPRVSAVHCTFYELNGKLMLKDSGSTNGTFLNGKKLDAPAPVFRGSVVALGEKGPEFSVDCDLLPPVEHTVENTNDGQASAPKPVPPPVPALKAPAPAPAPAAAAIPALKLTGRTGSLNGQTREFTVPVVTVGRGDQSLLRLDPFQDQAASTNHCEIHWTGSGYKVKDLGSRNGTYINGAKVTGEAPLPSGAVLRLGERGPEFLAAYGMAPAGSPAPAPVPAPGVKQGIGLMTLEGKLAEAKRDVRKEYRWKLASVLAMVLVLLAVGGGVAAWQWEEITKRQRRHETNLERIESEQVDFTRVNDTAAGAVYGVFFMERLSGDRLRIGFVGSAFAINNDLRLLGTNSHVAVVFNELRGANQSLVVIRSGDPKYMYRVKRVVLHPQYQQLAGGRAAMCPDVAVLETERTTYLRNENLDFPQVLKAASNYERSDHIKPGMPLCLIGYPGEYSHDYENIGAAGNVAKMLTGTANAVLNFSSGPATGANFDLLQHNCDATGGTSGSAVMNKDGRVIALHFAGRNVTVATVTEDASGRKVTGTTSLRGSGITIAVNVKYLIELVQNTYGKNAWGD